MLRFNSCVVYLTRNLVQWQKSQICTACNCKLPSPRSLPVLWQEGPRCSLVGLLEKSVPGAGEDSEFDAVGAADFGARERISPLLISRIAHGVASVFDPAKDGGQPGCQGCMGA